MNDRQEIRDIEVPSVSMLRENASSPKGALIDTNLTMVISSDGRNLPNPYQLEKDSPGFCAQFAGLNYNFQVFHKIIPALDWLNNNNLITPATMGTFIQNSPYLLEGRKNLWVNGFLAGFKGDFAQALHLLIPQFENGLRKRLESLGQHVFTTEDGLDSEMSLNQLLELPRSQEELGEDIHFNLKILLTEKAAFNIRNDMCHGLMAENQFMAPQSIYCWWLIFKSIIDSIPEVQ